MESERKWGECHGRDFGLTLLFVNTLANEFHRKMTSIDINPEILVIGFAQLPEIYQYRSQNEYAIPAIANFQSSPQRK